MLKRVSLVLMVLLAATSAAASSHADASRIEARFDGLLLDGEARGAGFLVGIPRPNTNPPEPIYMDLSGEDVTVETWTRYYRTVAGVSTQDPDRQDGRGSITYGEATAVLRSQETDADMAVVPLNDAESLVVSTSISTGQFQLSDRYLYTNEMIVNPLYEAVGAEHPSDPKYYHAAGKGGNFQHISSASDNWVQIDGSFTLTFLYGTIEIHNETGSYSVDARREHIAGTPPVYQEYSVTRAFVHVANGSAYVQPGGRPMQVNLAGYDIPAVSAVRLVNATGTWTGGGDAVPFEDANVRVAGDGLRLTAVPVASGGDLFQRGHVNGEVEQLFIDGRPVPVGSPETITTESPQAPAGVSVALLVLAVVAVFAAAWMVRRTRRRRQAGPLAERARDLLDVEDYPGASFWAKKAIRRNPRHGEAATVLAMACLQMGQPGEAVAHLERVRLEDDPLVRLMLSVSLRQAGQPEQAKRMLKSLLREHPELADVVAGTDLDGHMRGFEGTRADVTGYG